MERKAWEVASIARSKPEGRRTDWQGKRTQRKRLVLPQTLSPLLSQAEKHPVTVIQTEAAGMVLS